MTEKAALGVNPLEQFVLLAKPPKVKINYVYIE